MNSPFEQYLLKVTESSACLEIEVMQTLWSGYGKISRYELLDSPLKTVVIKNIAPEAIRSHPRGWDTNHSHKRKLKSYEIETHWYESWNQFCTNNCKTPNFIGSFASKGQQWIIMEDLTAEFPIIKTAVDLTDIKTGLKWLANFHALFLGKKSSGLWKTGTYWHLETRRDEFENLTDKELIAKAPLIDDLLNRAEFQTIVHGDAKLANFCFSADEKNVAAVDFQYVGGGCGMKDVSYFLGSCLDGEALEAHETMLLNDYFSELAHAITRRLTTVDLEALEAEWRALFPIASADFTRFLLGWMPTHQKVNDYSLKVLNKVLTEL